MNSNAKGKRIERAWAKRNRDEGYRARRGQQFAGGEDSPDVINDDKQFIHYEVKGGKRISVLDAIDQAKRDCGAKMPVVAVKYDRCDWFVAMPAEVFFDMLREFEG